MNERYRQIIALLPDSTYRTFTVFYYAVARLKDDQTEKSFLLHEKLPDDIDPVVKKVFDCISVLTPKQLPYTLKLEG